PAPHGGALPRGARARGRDCAAGDVHGGAAAGHRRELGYGRERARAADVHDLHRLLPVRQPDRAAVGGDAVRRVGRRDASGHPADGTGLGRGDAGARRPRLPARNRLGGAAPGVREGSVMRLANKVAVITGAASGQGRAAAELFAAEGARLALTDWSGEAGQQVAEALRAAGHEVLFVRGDVSRAADGEALRAATLERFGQVDVLYNNAGVSFSGPFRVGTVLDIPEDDWDAMIA